MLLNEYKNGNCKVQLFADGTKKRYVLKGQKPRPLFPENIDVKITNWCDAGCEYCHEASTPTGTHADLEPTLNLLKQMPAGTEIAIGGGHPMSHPEFDNFVTELTANGIVPNVTINEHHFLRELPRIEKLVADGSVKGIGYSYTSTPCDWEYEHLVSHVIAGTVHQDQLDDIIRTNKKILLLGYKNFRKGKQFIQAYPDEVANNLSSWYSRLFETVEKAQVSFDNLAIEQLKPQRVFRNRNDYDMFYMGDEGGFSMYMDAVLQKVAQASFMNERHPITDRIESTFDLVNIYKESA